MAERLSTKFADDDSFNQDIVVEPIANFQDSVWFDNNSQLQTRSDSNWAIVLKAVATDDYNERWPDGSGLSVSTDRTGEAYFNKPDQVIVGEFLYLKETKRKLHLMTNGAVYEDDEKFKAVVDDLAGANITIKSTRERKLKTCYSRKFDGGDWLEKENETVFGFIPVIPMYANFKINEDKVIYWGVVEKLLDIQRVYNYSLSREVEEGALAPRSKYWMTDTQMEGYEDELATLNTSANPVQGYNVDPLAPGPPQQSGGAQINPGLRNISESMRLMANQVAGMFAASMGDNPGLQSGVAIDALQDKGDIGTIKFFQSREIAICHTAKIIIDAIPRVYDDERQIRILNEDGSFDMATINTQVTDAQTGELVALNDLSKGVYDVICTAGPSSKSRQQETVSAMLEVAQVDPSIIDIGGDILLNSVASPGMDKVAERKRAQLINRGEIPFDQMTDEEKQQAQAAANQPPPPDPNMLFAQAEMTKAENEQLKIQQNGQVEFAKLQVKQQELQQNELKIQQQNAQMQINAIFTQQKQQMELLTAAVTQMKTLTEAFGVESIAGQEPANLIVQQGQLIDEIQDNT